MGPFMHATANGGSGGMPPKQPKVWLKVTLPGVFAVIYKSIMAIFCPVRWLLLYHLSSNGFNYHLLAPIFYFASYVIPSKLHSTLYTPNDYA